MATIPGFGFPRRGRTRRVPRTLWPYGQSSLDGQIRWRRTAPAEKLETFAAPGGPAAATPVTDGTHVYVYFGSFGLLCYDFSGTVVWSLPLPVPVTGWGRPRPRFLPTICLC